jgi:hypothetical protein
MTLQGAQAPGEGRVRLTWSTGALVAFLAWSPLRRSSRRSSG